MAINYGRITSVISERLYPLVIERFKKNESKFKANIANFFNRNHDAIYDIAPYNNIYYTNTDRENLLKSVGITEDEINNIMRDCFFWKKPINPPAIKEPYVQTLMCILMYYLKNKKQKDAEITCIYMAFSGKFYASLFGKFFPYAPPSKYRAVMDYVVNNMLNDKFSLKTTGSLFGAIRQMCITIIDTYQDTIIKDPDDEEIKYFVQQVRDREWAFISNIAKLYYKAYEDRNYLNYESDNVSSPEEFRITESDATVAARITENTVNYMLNNAVSLKVCNNFSDPNIRPTELRDIVDSIVGDKKCINDLYRVCNILICDFMRRNPKKRVGSVEFIEYSLKEQPNTRDQYIIEMQNIIVGWLDEKSERYRKRKSRKATAISYRKAIKYYITMTIAKVANNTR